MKSRPSSAAPPGKAPSFRVLIVDQEETSRKFLASVLKQPGYETALAANGFEAIAVAESRGPFDLLVTDVRLREMKGDELARRLRWTDPDLKILYLTDKEEQLFEERTSLWEEEAFLDKPVTAQGLLEAVSLMLVGHLPAPRAIRVPVPGARVRFTSQVAELALLSVSGTLVRAAQPLAVESSWPLTLELPDETVHLTGRVVSCRGSGAEWSIAFAFVQPPAPVRRALERVVQAHKQ
jgi:CheY-like chemotaxis protein